MPQHVVFVNKSGDTHEAKDEHTFQVVLG